MSLLNLNILYLSSNGSEERELVLSAVVPSETLAKIVSVTSLILHAKIVHRRPVQVRHGGIPVEVVKMSRTMMATTSALRTRSMRVGVECSKVLEVGMLQPCKLCCNGSGNMAMHIELL